MDCRDIQEKLSSYIEQELSREEKSHVEGHLNACASCSRELEDLRKTIALTQGIDAAEPPPWLRQKVMARVREEAGQKRSMLQKLFFPLHIKVPLEVFATVAIAVTAFYLFRAVEPEIKPPVSVTVPSVDIQEKEKTEVSGQSEIFTPEKRPAAPETAEKKAEAEHRAPVADIGEEAAPVSEEKAVRQQASGAADFRMKKELRSLAPSVMMKAAEADKKTMSMTVFVKDTVGVSEEIEKVIKKLGGEIIRSESVDNKQFFMVTLESGKVKELRASLNLIGEVEEETAVSITEGSVTIGIKVIKTEVRLH